MPIAKALRASMDEPPACSARALRHEIGHYYQVLALTGDRREEFRALFGDETTSYRRPCSTIIQLGRARTGRATSSAPTRPCIHSKTLPVFGTLAHR